MKVCILTIGTEILDGSTDNSNARWIAERLTEEGVQVMAQISVGDDPVQIEDAVKTWMTRADLVISTGGLGATPDDKTRQSMARALGRKLVLHEATAKLIREKIQRLRPGTETPEDAAALLPMGAEVLDNPVGLAPGFLLHEGAAGLLVLPGVPREMEEMIHLHLSEILSRRPRDRVTKHRTIHTAGRPETFLAGVVEPLLPPEIHASYLPHYGRVDVRLRMEGTDADVTLALASAVETVSDALGNAVFGLDDETIEEVVGKLLVDSARTLALAESLTGGSLGSRVTRVSGSSRYYLGTIVAYSNRAKEDLLGVDPEILRTHGAVSDAVARAMARGARKALGSDIAVSTTGIAGPTGGSPDKPVGLVYIGLDDGKRPLAFRRQFGTDRQLNTERVVVTSLNLLRLALIGELRDESGEGDPSPDKK
jgi:nicotinamide-nucleotide amidase